MTVDELVAWLNKTYPTRDWNQWCQRLMWNCVYALMGYERDSQVTGYERADLARDESHIESRDASAAPAGAMHWWRNPTPDGHVGMSLGGSRVLMTGTKEALGDGGVMLGTNYGVTTVEAYVRAKRNPYLGWSRTNGNNPTLIGKLTTTKPVPVIPEEEDEDMNIGMYKKVGAIYHVTIGNLTSGLKFKYTTGSSAYNNLKATQFKTGSFTEEDQSVIDRFEQALDAVRQGK